MFLNDKYIYNCRTHTMETEKFRIFSAPGATIWLDNLRVAIKKLRSVNARFTNRLS
jgi:hypothetical protein